jgi:hypothetical protein
VLSREAVLRQFLRPILGGVAMGLCSCVELELRRAQVDDSVEAYDAFLAEHPRARQSDEIRSRIDTLRYLRAIDTHSAAAFRDYLAKHPDGRHAARARVAEDELAWREAEAVGTAAAARAYLATHPDGIFARWARALAAGGRGDGAPPTAPPEATGTGEAGLMPGAASPSPPLAR